jgi:hypothetical protein
MPAVSLCVISANKGGTETLGIFRTLLRSIILIGLTPTGAGRFSGEFDHSVPASSTSRRSRYDRRRGSNQGRGSKRSIGTSRLPGDQDRNRYLCQTHTGDLTDRSGATSVVVLVPAKRLLYWADLHTSSPPAAHLGPTRARRNVSIARSRFLAAAAQPGRCTDLYLYNRVMVLHQTAFQSREYNRDRQLL